MSTTARTATGDLEQIASGNLLTRESFHVSVPPLSFSCCNLVLPRQSGQIGISPARDLAASQPPSILISDPVTKLESSDARKTAAPAISSGCPQRPIKVLAGPCLSGLGRLREALVERGCDHAWRDGVDPYILAGTGPRPWHASAPALHSWRHSRHSIRSPGEAGDGANVDDVAGSLRHHVRDRRAGAQERARSS